MGTRYRRSWRLGWVGALVASAGVGAVEAPIAVSPGRSSESVLVSEVCPTFSWSAVTGVESVEIVAYRVSDGEEERTELILALQRELPGSASSWTPSLESCLEREGRYAWTVRSRLGEVTSDWAAPLLLEVPAGPSEEELEAALRVVQRYFESRESDAGSGTSEESNEQLAVTAGATISVAAAPPAPRSVTAGEPALVINGSPVVTVATLSGALCGMTRFLDQGDGTVLDCNTGLYWLKDAGCLSSSALWPSAQSQAASLEDGDCGLTDGSAAGQWRLPTIYEFCDAPDPIESVTGFCLSGYAATSLVNMAFADPVVSNARGDGQWSESDAFVNVNEGATLYWTSNEQGLDALTIDLGNGLIDWESQGSAYQAWPVRDALP